MIYELARGRLLGHPVHVMLVHFPTALFPFSLFLDLWGIWVDNPDLFLTSLYSLLAGLGAGLWAVIFGLIDYLKLTEQPNEFRKASWHAGIQICMTMIFGVVAGIRLQNYPELVEPGFLELCSMSIAIVIMLAGNYLGGDLVFRDGVGVHDQ